MAEQMTQAVQNFLILLVTGILGVLASFLIALAKKGFDWVSAKVDSVKSETSRKSIANAVSTLDNLVEVTVTSLQQSLGDDIKQSIKLNDGKYTREDLLALKDTAFQTIKSQLSESATEALNQTYSDVDALINDLIETQIKKMKEGISSGVSSVLLE